MVEYKNYFDNSFINVLESLMGKIIWITTKFKSKCSLCKTISFCLLWWTSIFSSCFVGWYNGGQGAHLTVHLHRDAGRKVILLQIRDFGTSVLNPGAGFLRIFIVAFD